MTAQKALSDKDMNGRKVVNHGEPTAAGDVATKTYVDGGDTAASSRANHTGTQTAGTISDFDAQVRTSRVDQLAAPTAPVNLNDQRLVSVSDPSVAQDAATKAYVDSQVAGLASGQVLKGAVTVAATTDVDIASPGASIDGEALTAGDVVLLTAQATGSQNGPYVWNGAATAMTRADNWDASADADLGSYWVVVGGSKADQFALLTNDAEITLDTTEPTFAFIGGATSILRYSVDCPAIAAGATWTVTHNLSSQDVQVAVRRVASPYDYVDVYSAASTANTVSVVPDVAMAEGEYRAIVKY